MSRLSNLPLASNESEVKSSKLLQCRICHSEDLVDVIDLGHQVNTAKFPLHGDDSLQKYPVVLCKCEKCHLLQMRYSTPQSDLYEHEYGYRSGISNTMRSHLKAYQKQMEERYTIAIRPNDKNIGQELDHGDLVVDIGSNDATLLKFYPEYLQRVGVDPTGNQFKEFYNNIDLVPTYFTRDCLLPGYGKAKIVSSISMFYDLPDPVQFAKDISSILDDEGIWTCEQSYMPLMIQNNSLDTICHEHLEYYALHQVKDIAERADLKIIDVSFNDCNGGSFRVYFAKKTSNRPEYSDLQTILDQELYVGMDTQEYYRDFMSKVHDEVFEKLTQFLRWCKEAKQQTWIYGASTKGNCLLQYANVYPDKCKYAVERNPKKIGKQTSTGIEIISEEIMRENPPEYLLVLPWHFREEIIAREKEFLDAGGKLIFPLPKFEIVSRKPTLLITGIDGMIASYVKEEFTDYDIYGVHSQRTLTSDGVSVHREKDQSVSQNRDVISFSDAETAIAVVNPDVVIHLAGISSSVEANLDPLRTMKTTDMFIKICQKTKPTAKIFNASSSEIYKGHISYWVNEDDHNYYSPNPYGINKIASHQMAQFYRRQGKHVSNGVLFTVESNRKSNKFLLPRLAKYLSMMSEARDAKSIGGTAITCGKLDSFRNIIHGSDVARAIRLCLTKPDDYLICNEWSYQMKDLVKMLYKTRGITLIEEDGVFYAFGKPVLYMNGQGSDEVPTDINGFPDKLKAMGWDPTYIDDILKSL